MKVETEGADGTMMKDGDTQWNHIFSSTLHTCNVHGEAVFFFFLSVLRRNIFELTLSRVVQPHASPLHGGAGTLPGRQKQAKATSTTTTSRWNAATADTETSEEARQVQSFTIGSATHKKKKKKSVKSLSAASKMHVTPFPVSLLKLPLRTVVAALAAHGIALHNRKQQESTQAMEKSSERAR